MLLCCCSFDRRRCQGFGATKVLTDIPVQHCLRYACSRGCLHTFDGSHELPKMIFVFSYVHHHNHDHTTPISIITISRSKKTSLHLFLARRQRCHASRFIFLPFPSTEQHMQTRHLLQLSNSPPRYRHCPSVATLSSTEAQAQGRRGEGKPAWLRIPPRPRSPARRQSSGRRSDTATPWSWSLPLPAVTPRR